MKTFAELVRRYSEVQAVPFAELALTLDCPLPIDPTVDEGYAGRLMEKVGNKAPDSLSAPDLEDFDIEVKTVPIGPDMGPLQPTKITALNPSTLEQEEWFTSHAYRKLRVLLFVPVVKASLADAAAWYVRHPFVWLPPSDNLRQLQEDWEEIRKVVLTQGIVALSSKTTAPGKYLMTKTSYEGKGGKKRYSFWLRKPYVADIIKSNIGYEQLRGA